MTEEHSFGCITDQEAMGLHNMSKEKYEPLSNEEILIGPMMYGISTMMSCFTSGSDKRLEPILEKLKDLGVIKSWYYNGTYHAS